MSGTEIDETFSDHSDVGGLAGMTESADLSLQTIVDYNALSLDEDGGSSLTFDVKSSPILLRNALTSIDFEYFPYSPPVPRLMVFRNWDIMEMVFARFDEESENNGNHSTGRIAFPHSQYLLWASLTCKDFFEPAMNILWRSVNSVPQWLGLLPTFTKSGDDYTTTGPIIKESVERLKQYSRRIRHFTVETLTGGVSAHIYYFIDRFSDGELLSCLNTLHIKDLRADALYGLLLMSSSPTIFDLSIGEINHSHKSQVDALLHSSFVANPSSLKRLSLQGNISRISLEQVSKFRHVSVLGIHIQDTALGSNVLSIFAAMQSLQTFKFSCDKISTFTRSSAIAHFTSLQEIDFSGHVSMILGLLDSMTTSNLTTVTLNFIVAEEGILAPSAQPQALADACVKRCTEITPFLRKINIMVVLGGLPAMAPLPTSTGLQALAKCKLKYLGMPLNTLPSNRFSAVLSATEWNNLDVLCLHIPMRPYQGSTAPTLLTLTHIASGCPNLRLLQITVSNLVEASCVARMHSAVAQFAPLKHNLQILRIFPFHGKLEAQRATMKSGVTVSRYINHFFPRLKFLDLSKFSPFVGTQWCEGVVAMVKSYQALEAQRLRIASAERDALLLQLQTSLRLSDLQVASLLPQNAS